MFFYCRFLFSKNILQIKHEKKGEYVKGAKLKASASRKEMAIKFSVSSILIFE
ncbi:hypothetical protein [Kaistella flava (ex Peng et al. 2021)]|uniref:hypothetical protein n=1 Tax=Kaistella flava (ex Peng et al. 2021) TaxID=2038776 RepID=UPI00187F912C|nr:hypothetical protein [Kaistella flava (ex Peng et al. 2021)]